MSSDILDNPADTGIEEPIRVAREDSVDEDVELAKPAGHKLGILDACIAERGRHTGSQHSLDRSNRTEVDGTFRHGTHVLATAAAGPSRLTHPRRTRA